MSKNFLKYDQELYTYFLYANYCAWEQHTAQTMYANQLLTFFQQQSCISVDCKEATVWRMELVVEQKCLDLPVSFLGVEEWTQAVCYDILYTKILIEKL